MEKKDEMEKAKEEKEDENIKWEKWTKRRGLELGLIWN